jgi:hypothetical protein
LFLYHRQLRFEPLEDRRLMSITVNTLIDENNGIGVGGISLRDAIAAAAPGETIDFTVTGEIVLTHGQLSIGKSLTIQGPGANLLSIRPTTPFPPGGTRVLGVNDSSASLADVQLIGLTLRGGFPHGAAPAEGGAIHNAENLTLTSCIITDNRAGNGTFNNGQGGAIFSSAGSLVVNDSTIGGNVSDGSGGGIFVGGGSLTVTDSIISGNRCTYSGGGMFASGNVTVTGSVISNNMAGAGWNGGGMYASGAGMVAVTESIVRDNAAASGGGIYRTSGRLTVTDSTIEVNDSTNGGGVFLSSTTTSVNQSVISGNTASFQGGGIYNRGGALTVTGGTVSFNQAGYGGGILGRDGGSVTVSGTTIASNGFDPSSNGNGGGIEVIFTTLTVSNSTISGNWARGGGGIQGGGGILSYVSTTNINHSTITANVTNVVGRRYPCLWRFGDAQPHDRGGQFAGWQPRRYFRRGGRQFLVDWQHCGRDDQWGKQYRQSKCTAWRIGRQRRTDVDARANARQPGN